MRTISGSGRGVRLFNPIAGPAATNSICGGRLRVILSSFSGWILCYCVLGVSGCGNNFGNVTMDLSDFEQFSMTRDQVFFNTVTPGEVYNASIEKLEQDVYVATIEVLAGLTAPLSPPLLEDPIVLELTALQVSELKLIFSKVSGSYSLCFSPGHPRMITVFDWDARVFNDWECGGGLESPFLDAETVSRIVNLLNDLSS